MIKYSLISWKWVYIPQMQINRPITSWHMKWANNKNAIQLSKKQTEMLWKLIWHPWHFGQTQTWKSKAQQEQLQQQNIG